MDDATLFTLLSVTFAFLFINFIINVVVKSKIMRRSRGFTINVEPTPGEIKKFQINTSMTDIEIGTVLKDIKRSVLFQRPPRAEHFVGREKELRKLIYDLQPGRLVTLTGPGGIGKTSLASEVIWKLAPNDELPERFPDGIIFYSFYGKPDISLAFEHIIHSYDETARDTSPKAVKDLLAQKTNLLVFDGAEVASDLMGIIDLCGKSNCVLITSRKLDDAMGDLQEISPLNIEEAICLLKRWGGKWVPEDKSAKEICERVGKLPLALRLIGVYLSHHHTWADVYLRWLKSFPMEALNQGNRKLDSIPLLLRKSLDQVSDKAQTLLGLVGRLASNPFSLNVICAGMKIKNFEAEILLKELVNIGLLYYVDGRWQVCHILIYTYAREQIIIQTDVLLLLAEYYIQFARSESIRGSVGYIQLEYERPHIIHILDECKHEKLWGAIRGLVWDIDDFLDLQGYWSERIMVLKMGIEAAQRTKELYDEVSFLGNLGNSFSNQGQIEQAIEYHKQALGITRKINDHYSEGVCLSNLGNAFSLVGQIKEAINYYQQALAIAQKVDDYRNEGNRLGTLGNALSKIGETDRAMEYFEKSLSIAREIFDRRGEGNALSNIGSALINQGQVEKGVPYFDQALEIACDLGDLRGEENRRGNLGNAYHLLSQINTAIKYHEQSLAIAREIGDRRGEGSALGNLGNIYQDLVKISEANDLFQGSFSIAKEVGDQLSIEYSLGNLGNLYQDLEQIDTAMEYYQKALAIAIKNGDRRGEGICLFNIGIVFFTNGMIKEALDSLHHAVDIAREIGDRFTECRRLGFLSVLYDFIGQKEKAFEYQKLVLSINQHMENTPKHYSNKSDTLIHLDGNKPGKIKYEHYQYFNQENDQYITRPNEIQHISNFQYLDLSHSKLKSISEGISQLVNINCLFLDYNLLTTIPESIAQLTNLYTLNLSNNKLITLPDGISHLSNLRFLDLSFNLLENLPTSITHLTNIQSLHLKFNRLTSLPDSISQLTSLQTLDSRLNLLENIPVSITKMSQLQVLYLGNNKLTGIPDSIDQLTNLKTLDLSNNQLTKLPENIINLHNLQTLDLSNNFISFLPEGISHLTNLQTLILSNNQLTSLPEDFAQLTHLHKLALNHNRLSKLSKNLFQLPDLQYLDLSENMIEFLPGNIAQLISLQTLILYTNQLSSVPRGITQLSNLQVLDLNNNHLKKLPHGFKYLTKLRELSLKVNELSTVPKSIIELKTLQSLDLSNNKLSIFPDAITELPNLKSLIIKFNQLTSLPESITKLYKLQSLDIRFNQLTSLPEGIAQLTNLEKLEMSVNEITELPVGLAKLTKLSFLDLSNNKLKVFPECITQLINLQDLDLSYNQISMIKGEISNLSNLQKLNLSYNQLGILPEGIVNLSNLKELYLRINQLTILPNDFSQMTNLQTLDLKSNKLITLPTTLIDLPNLEQLDLHINPLNPELSSAYEGGLNSLLSYLKSLADENKREKLYESKLILVGEGNVGKTTLLKALTGQETKTDEPTTHGVSIDILALNLRHPDMEDVFIQFNAWDFGGQEVYRVTHQFFFSCRSIYLLIWEPRRGVQQCQVEDWLKIIRLRVGNSARVIIVSTHCRTGERIARIDKSLLLREFGPLIAGFHDVDSLVDDPNTGEKVGIYELKELISNSARELDQMGMVFNRDWRETRDEFLHMEEAHISFQRFLDISARHGLDDLSASTLAHLMHDLGYIVYYGDDDRLKNDVILQPSWLTKAIGYVLDDKITLEMGGLLLDNRLVQVWRDHPFVNEPRYDPSLYPFFLRLMEKFDVSFRLEQGNASLVAQDVPQERPSLPWVPENLPSPGKIRIALVCDMDEIPPGLVPWMIVRTHDFSFEGTDINGKMHRYHWQKGMFLQKTTHGQAYLELRDRQFHIYTEAIWPEYFMKILQDILQKLIIDNWPGMTGRYRFSVPCQERMNNKPCEGLFSINALHQFLDEGDEEIRCQICRNKQNIVSLLYGFKNEDSRKQIERLEKSINRGCYSIDTKTIELESRINLSLRTILRAIANESNEGPRLFHIEPPGGVIGKNYSVHHKLHFWCEEEGCQHPVIEEGKGVYDFDTSHERFNEITPYANFIISILKTLTPLAYQYLAIQFGSDIVESWKIEDHLEYMKDLTEKSLREVKYSDESNIQNGILSNYECSGIQALHAVLKEKDPYHERLGLRRFPTYSGDFLWLCKFHYEQIESKIPERIEF